MVRYLIIIQLFNSLTVAGQMVSYPVPAENPNMLFYLQRSLDLNSVIYEAKYEGSNGKYRKIDTEDPVNIYWLINDKEGSTKPLATMQKLGYGIRTANLDGDIVQMKLIAYREMGILLKPSAKDDRYHAHISLEGKDVILTKVFINIDGGTKLKPNVTFVEITGTESATGKKMVHRFQP